MIIHVNQHHIRANAKDSGDRPVFTIKAHGKTRYAKEVEIHGPSKLIYDGRQLSCGARAWIETRAPVTLIGEMRFQDV